MSDRLEHARDKVLEEFRRVERQLVRVWDVLGYALNDPEEKELLRWEIEGGIIVQVRSWQSQKPEDLFRVRDGWMRPRWKVRLAQHHRRMKRMSTGQVWVRGPAIKISTGERESKFRYLSVPDNIVGG